MNPLTLTKYCIIFACMMFMQNTQAQKLPPDNPNYQLVFSDDFDSIGINHNNWRTGYSWGIVDHWGIFPNGDTLFAYYINPQDSDSLFEYHIDSSYLRLPFKHYPGGFQLGVWNYSRIDTLETATTILRDWSYYGPHVNTVISHTYLDDDTTNNVCFGAYPVQKPYDTYQIDSLFNNNLLKVVRTCYRREFHYANKTYYYATPLLMSYNKYRYGYFEIRTRMPNLDGPYDNMGTGPAFWLWGSDSIVPHSEVDIYEIKDYSPEFDNYGCYLPFDTNAGHYKHNLTNTIHFQDTIMAQSDITVAEHMSLGHLLFCDTCFKTLSAFWDKQSIKFYRDDTLIRDSYFYPDKLSNMQIIFSVNDPSWVIKDTTGVHIPLLPGSTTLPDYNYDVDYIRVYQLKLHCDSDCTVSSFNPDTFGYGLYRTITIGTGTSVIASGKNVEIMATDGITINGDFTVQPGAELLIETKPCQEEQNQTKSDTEEPKILPPNFYQHFIHE